VIVYDTVSNNCHVTTYDTVKVLDTVSVLKVKFKLTTGIKANQETTMRVYPNPTNGVCKIALSSAIQEQAQITVLSITGQTVHTTVIATNAEQELQLDLPAGIYLIKAQTATELYTSKIVIER
jgi:hypothetical protein